MIDFDVMNICTFRNINHNSIIENVFIINLNV